MPVKTVEMDGKKYAVLDDAGKVVYTDANGGEVGYDAEDLATRLASLNAEATIRRAELKTATDKLASFEGIEDPEAARKALATVKNLDDKKLMDAGEVDTIKAEAIKATETRYDTLIKEKYEPAIVERDDLRARLDNEIIGNLFASSPFIKDKLVVPTEMVRATFGHHFSVEDGRVSAKDGSGAQVFSKERPGDVADFNEALELIVGASPRCASTF